MANMRRGEVEISFEGQGTKVLRYTMGAICELEDHFGGRSIQKVFGDAEATAELTSRDLLMLLYVGLKHGSEPQITLDALGGMVNFPELADMLTVIMEAFTASTTGQREAPKVAGNPPVLQSLGTGLS